MKSRIAFVAERVAAAQAADSLDAWQRAVTAWAVVDGEVSGELMRKGFSARADLDRPELSAEAKQCAAHQDAFTALTQTMFSQLLNSDHEPRIEEEYGSRLCALMQLQLRTQAERCAEKHRTIRHLTSAYEKKINNGMTECGTPIPEALAKFSEPDDGIRRSAMQPALEWFSANRAEFGGLFAELVDARTAMAVAAGDRDFQQFGYDALGRTSLTMRDVATFRAAVIQHLVPLFERICTTASPNPLDLFNIHVGGRPLPARLNDDPEALVAGLPLVFGGINSPLQAIVSGVLAGERVDLFARPAKAPGAYCAVFPDTEQVGLFANWLGDLPGLLGLIHELGHAVQSVRSFELPLPILQKPTFEIAELAAHSAELLSLAHLHVIVGQELVELVAERRLRSGLYQICYACCLDEFQAWVYENPDVDVRARERAWLDAFQTYFPGLAYDQAAERLVSARWYAQMHLFRFPFYAIDYALAEVVALDLAGIQASDRELGGDIFSRLCGLGGSLGFAELLDELGLPSPTDAHVVEGVSQYLARRLFYGRSASNAAAR